MKYVVEIDADSDDRFFIAGPEVRTVFTGVEAWAQTFDTYEHAAEASFFVEHHRSMLTFIRPVGRGCHG